MIIRKKFSLFLISSLVSSTPVAYAGRGDDTPASATPAPAATVPTTPKPTTPTPPVSVIPKPPVPVNSTPSPPTDTSTTAPAVPADDNSNLALKAGLGIGGAGLAVGTLALIGSKVNSTKDKMNLNKKQNKIEKTQESLIAQATEIGKNAESRNNELKENFTSGLRFLRENQQNEPHVIDALNQVEATHQAILEDLKEVKAGNPEAVHTIREKINTMLHESTNGIKNSVEAREFLIKSSKDLMDHANDFDPMNRDKLENSLQIPHELMTVREGVGEQNPYKSHAEYINVSGIQNKEISKVVHEGSITHQALNKKIEKASNAWFFKESKLKKVGEEIQNHLNKQAEKLPPEKHITENMPEKASKEAENHNNALESARKSSAESGVQLTKKLNEKLVSNKMAPVAVKVSAKLHVEPRIVERHVSSVHMRE